MAMDRWSPARSRTVLTTPTAGAVWTRRNDRGALLLVKSVVFTLATSAVVANRTVILTAHSDGSVWFRTSAAAAQAAGLTRVYTAWPGQPPGGVDVGSGRIGWPSDSVLLRPGDTLALTVDSIDVGDQVSGVVLDEWEYPDTLPAHLVPSPYLYALSEQE